MEDTVSLLVGALHDRYADYRKKLKALTISNEMVYDELAIHFFRASPGLPEALAKLRGSKNTGLGAPIDENIRMLATEMDKTLFSEGAQAVRPGQLQKLKQRFGGLATHNAAGRVPSKDPSAAAPMTSTTNFYFDNKHQRWRQHGIDDGLHDGPQPACVELPAAVAAAPTATILSEVPAVASAPAPVSLPVGAPPAAVADGQPAAAVDGEAMQTSPPWAAADPAVAAAFGFAGGEEKFQVAAHLFSPPPRATPQVEENAVVPPPIAVKFGVADAPAQPHSVGVAAASSGAAPIMPPGPPPIATESVVSADPAVVAAFGLSDDQALALPPVAADRSAGSLQPPPFAAPTAAMEPAVASSFGLFDVNLAAAEFTVGPLANAALPPATASAMVSELPPAVAPAAALDPAVATAFGLFDGVPSASSKTLSTDVAPPPMTTAVPMEACKPPLAECPTITAAPATAEITPVLLAASLAADSAASSALPQDSSGAAAAAPAYSPQPARALPSAALVTPPPKLPAVDGSSRDSTLGLPAASSLNQLSAPDFLAPSPLGPASVWPGSPSTGGDTPLGFSVTPVAKSQLAPLPELDFGPPPSFSAGLSAPALTPASATAAAIATSVPAVVPALPADSSHLSTLIETPQLGPGTMPEAVASAFAPAPHAPMPASSGIKSSSRGVDSLFD